MRIRLAVMLVAIGLAVGGLLLIGGPAGAVTPPALSWQALFDSGGSEGVPTFGVDVNGNQFSAFDGGNTPRLVRRSATGVQQFALSLPGGLIAGLGVSSAGECFVMRWVTNVASGVRLTRVSSSGSVVWSTDLPASGSGGFRTPREQVVLDASTNSLYITGTESSSGAPLQGFVTRLAMSSGAVVWDRTWSCPSTTDGGPVLAVKAGSDPVVAISANLGKTQVIRVSRTTGAVVYLRTYDFGERAGIRAMDTDASALPVLGLSTATPASAPTNYLTVKLKSNGDIAWSQQLGGVNNDAPATVVVAGDGTVYVGGTTDAGAGAPGFGALTRYSSTGVLLSHTATATPGSAQWLALDGTIAHLLVNRGTSFGLVGFSASTGSLGWDVTHSDSQLLYGVKPFFNALQVSRGTLHVACRSGVAGQPSTVDGISGLAFRF